MGYQPTLATDLGGLQERITTTHKGSITSVQVPLSCLYPNSAPGLSHCASSSLKASAMIEHRVIQLILIIYHKSVLTLR